MLLISISAAYNRITAAKLLRHFLNCEGGTIQAVSVFKYQVSQAFCSRADWNLVFLLSVTCLSGWQRSCDTWEHLLKLTNTNRSGLVQEVG